MNDVFITDVNNYILKHKKELNKEIGSIIKEYRIERNISTEKLASRICVSQPYVTQVEKGDVGISLNRFIMICNGLQINPKEILDKFLFYSKSNEDLFYKELQENKNMSVNLLEFMKNKI